MNTKTKMMLGLSVLTAGTLAAGATGTFAWFTTNKTATATYNKIAVKGTTGNLNVAIKGITDSTAEAAAGTNVEASGATSYTSDVSSNDGINFYQPDWKTESGNDKGYNSIKNVSAKSGYFTQYLVTLKNTTTDTGAAPIAAQLTGVTIVVAGGTTTSITNDTMGKWVRVAVTSVGSAENGFLKAGDGAQTFVFENDTDTAYKKYITGDDANPGNSLSSKISSDWNEGVLNKTGTSLSVAPTAWTSIESGANVTLGVSVWVEGTSSDKQDDMKGATISVALTFASKDVIA